MITAGDVAIAKEAASAEGNQGSPIHMCVTKNIKLYVIHDSAMDIYSSPLSCRNQAKSNCLPRSNKMIPKEISTKIRVVLSTFWNSITTRADRW